MNVGRIVGIGGGGVETYSLGFHNLDVVPGIEALCIRRGMMVR